MALVRVVGMQDPFGRIRFLLLAIAWLSSVSMIGFAVPLRQASWFTVVSLSTPTEKVCDALQSRDGFETVMVSGVTVATAPLANWIEYFPSAPLVVEKPLLN